MTLPAILTLFTPSREISASETETIPPASSPFADFLNPDSAATDNAAILPDSAGDSLPAIALTPAEEPAPDTDDAEELPWPPEGLASLWPPTTAPEPAPQRHSTATPVPSTGSNPHATTTASIKVALTIQAPDTPPASLLSATPDALPAPEPPAQPASTPAIPASPEPASPESAAPPASSILKDINPLSHLPEQGQGENASTTAPASQTEFSLTAPQATPVMTTPSPQPFPLTQPQPTPATTPAPFPAPDLHAESFPDTVGSHIQWLAEHKIGHAHIHLNPQNLGPLEVHLQLDGDQLQARFNSTHIEVRQALEHALPHLRELLGEHSLNLAQSTVSQHPSQQQRPHSPLPASEFTATPPDDETTPQPAPIAQSAAAHTLLDAYA